MRAADRADGAAERAARPRRAPTLIPIVAPFPTDCRFGDFGGLPGRPAGVEAAREPERITCRERPEDLPEHAVPVPEDTVGPNQRAVCGGSPLDTRVRDLVYLLPPIHKDPFDRILVAQAQVEGITLLTVDARVARYPGPIRTV